VVVEVKEEENMGRATVNGLFAASREDWACNTESQLGGRMELCASGRLPSPSLPIAAAAAAPPPPVANVVVVVAAAC
jgi:hypothetical protein